MFRYVLTWGIKEESDVGDDNGKESVVTDVTGKTTRTCAVQT